MLLRDLRTLLNHALAKEGTGANNVNEEILNQVLSGPDVEEVAVVGTRVFVYEVKGMTILVTRGVLARSKQVLFIDPAYGKLLLNEPET